MESPVIMESASFAQPVINNDTGFPFDDSDYDSDLRFRGRLNNLAQQIPGLTRIFDDFDLRRHPHGFNDEKEDDLRFRAPSNHSGPSSSSTDPRSRFRDFPTEDRFFRHFRQPSEEKPPEAPRTQEKRSRRANPNLPQQLSNTVDLGQKQSPVNDNRSQRSMSAPPENRSGQNTTTRLDNDPTKQEPRMGVFGSKQQQPTQPKERIIPIHIEGRDELYIPQNRGTESSFGRDPSGFSSFKRDAPQFTREQHWQTPQTSTHHIPLNKQQMPPFPHHTPPTQQQTPTQPQAAAPPTHRTSPPPSNDPIEKIKCVKNDVLELMTQVDQFTGTRQDKNYAYLDEMLTRNLLKLDDIDTEGKENIRQARKEAIKCIQTCINKLDEKAQGIEKKSDAATLKESAATEVEAKLAENPSEPVNLNALAKPEEAMDIPEQPVYESKAVLFISGTPKSGVEIPQPKEEKPSTENTKMETENTGTSRSETKPADEKMDIVKDTEAQQAEPEPMVDAMNTSQTQEDTK